MITQMYFPGDPLFALDPIYQSITDQQARDRLVATYDHDVTEHEWAHRLPLGHRADRQPPHPDGDEEEQPRMSDLTADARPDDRPVLRLRAAVRPATASWCRRAARTRSACTALVFDGAGEPVPDALLEIWQADADGAVPSPEPGRCAATAARSPAGAAPAPTATATTRFTTRRPGATGRVRRRSSR